MLDPSREPLAARTVQGWVPADNGTGTAVASAGKTLIVGQGNTLRWLDTTSLTEQSAVEMPFEIESVAIDRDGTVTAAGNGFVAQLTGTGESMAAFELPTGFGPIATVEIGRAHV